MTDSTVTKSNSQNAAHLLAVLGWLILFIMGTIIASVLAVNFMAPDAERAGFWFWVILNTCVSIGFILLITAYYLKQHRQWARYLGGLLGFLALFAFPVGTVLGLFILSYLSKGWDES
ncbi:MAG: hypothetical protein COB34_04570 [Methylophilaceae bacterium]|nr:MAG: hypothetical protein COB34_04570 [Methylophilaceae bacterium]